MAGTPLSWGKPKVNVGLRGLGTAPTTWMTEHAIVENSAKLTPSKGTKKEAKIEGGENEAVKYNKNTYVFEYEVRVMDGRNPIIQDNDGLVEGEYALQLIPENPAVSGFIIDRAAVSVEDTWDAENGAKKKYTYDVLVPEQGNQVKWGVQVDKSLAAGLVVAPTSLSFTADADAVGQQVTVTSEANITSAKVPSNIEWVTVNRSGKVVTVKVLANANTDERTTELTIYADGKKAVVAITQAGTVE